MVRALLIAAVLLASSASAADANRQSDTWEAGADIDATAMAPLEDWFLFGTADTTGTTAASQDPIDPNLPVWYLWNEVQLAGQAPKWVQDRTGTSNPEGCETVQGAGPVPPSFTDCVGHVVAMDMAWQSEGLEGIAYVVGALDGDGEGFVEHYTSQGGLDLAIQFPGEIVNDVAISGNGEYIAVATTVVAAELGESDTGMVRLYPYGSDSSAWERAQEEPVTQVEIDVNQGNKARVMAAAGSLLLAFDFGGSTFADDIGTNLDARAVAVSHTLDQWAVAGFTQGHVNLYHTPDGQVYKRKANDNPDNEDVTIVDITPDGRFYAAADDDGDLFLFNNEFIDLGSPGLLEKIDLGDEIHDLAFSHNGRYLVVAADNTVHFYRISTSGLQAYWLDAHSNPVRHVEVSGDGATVLATVGDTVHRYAEDRDLSMTGPLSALTIEPGGKEQATVALKNDGNRDVDFTLSADAPAMWGVTFMPKSVTLPPGAQENVIVELVAADAHPAGDEQVTIKAASGSGTQELTLDVVVLQDRIWNVQSNGTLSVGVEAGGSATLAVIVTNEGNAADETTIIATVDKEGWSVTPQPASVRLDPDASTTVAIIVQAPTDAKELETANIQVSSLADPDVVVDLSATVGAHFGLTFEGTLAGPLHPDERKSFELTVTNVGNAPDSIQIRTEGLPRGWDLIYPDGNDPYTVFSLQPGASTTIPVTVAVDDDAELANYQFRLRATSLGDSTQSSVVTVTVAVEELIVDDPDGKDSPGAPAALLVLALLGVAAARRFRP